MPSNGPVQFLGNETSKLERFILTLEETKKKNPLFLIVKAVKMASPKYELKSKRMGGTVYQVPLRLMRGRAYSLSLRWILNDTVEKHSKKSFMQRLSHVMFETASGSSQAVKRKEELQRAVASNQVVS